MSCFIFFLCSLFSIAITSIGEERAYLRAFRTFVPFALLWFCPFPLLGRAAARRAGNGCGLPWFNYWFSFTLAYSRISHEYLSLFIIVINLIFMFSH